MTTKKLSKTKSAEVAKAEAELNAFLLNRAFQTALASVYPPKKKVARKRSPSKPKVKVMVPPQPEFDFGDDDAS